MADRFTYLPQIGLCIALVWGMADLTRSWSYHGWVRGVSSTLVLAVLMGCAWRQTSFWPDSETLWTHALACTSRNYMAHNVLGITLAGRGQVGAAIAHYQKALGVKPGYVEAHNNLANVLLGLGRWDEALKHLRKVAELSPQGAGPRNTLGAVLATVGRFDEALSQFREAVQIQPNDAEARKNLAWLRATCPQASLRNGAEAIEQARRADQLCGSRRPDVLDVLAAAYAEAGRFPEAVTTARKALELTRQQNQGALADALRVRLALYEAEKPYRQGRSDSMPRSPQP